MLCFFTLEAALVCNLVGRIIKGQHPAKLGEDLFQDLQALRGEVSDEKVDTRESPTGFGEAIDKSHSDRITPHAENDGGSCGRRFRRCNHRTGERVYQIDFLSLKIRRCLLGHLGVGLRILNG